jgi:MFS family permease
MTSSYVRLLADRRLRGLAAGDVISSIGDGMALVAGPWLALQLAQAEGVSEGVAVAAAATASTLFGLPLALAVGLGRRRFDPRSVLLADTVVRGALFLLMGALAAGGRLPLWALVILLGVSSVLRTVALSSRRLILTDLAGPDQRLTVNSLITTEESIALWTLGPALGGLLTATLGPAAVLAIDGLSFLPLLLATLPLAPGIGGYGVEQGRADGRSGLAVLRRHPLVIWLLLLTFGIDLLYYPVEVALPVHVARTFADAGVLGAIWTGFGVGAIVGSFLVGLLGRVPRWGVLLGATIGWAVALAAFAASRHPAASVATFALGGLLWVPFIPVAYTMVQDEVDADEQQPMITLWNAILQGVAPLSLAASGVLVAWFGATQTLWLSAETTLVLATVAVVALVVAHVRAGRRARATGEAGTR